MRIFTDQVALPCFLDFEASGLGARSYPIEVAWSLPTGEIECHLICPAPEWPTEAAWDSAAERLHGISLAELVGEGRDPAWLCHRMNARLQEQVVFCDGLPYDQFWLQRLFEATDTVPSFTLASLQAYCADLGLGPRQYEILSNTARRKVHGRAHRADVDVQYLIELYRLA